MSKSVKRTSKANSKAFWYTARVLLKAFGKDQPKVKALYEDRLMLVKATSLEEAQRRARTLAQATEVPYRNVHGNLVTWKVTHVLECVQLFENEWDGKQVYWRFIRTSNPRKALRATLMNPLQ